MIRKTKKKKQLPKSNPKKSNHRFLHEQIKDAKIKKEKLMKTEKLSQLASEAESEEVSGGFMDPAKKKKRGRRTNAEIERDRQLEMEKTRSVDPQVVNQLVENNKNFVRPIFKLASDLGVKYAEDQRAAIGPEVMEVMVSSAALCVHQYLPDVLNQHAALITLSLTFGQWSLSVYLLRQAKIRELQAGLETGEKYTGPTSANPDMTVPVN